MVNWVIIIPLSLKVPIFVQLVDPEAASLLDLLGVDPCETTFHTFVLHRPALQLCVQGGGSCFVLNERAQTIVREMGFIGSSSSNELITHDAVLTGPGGTPFKSALMVEAIMNKLRVAFPQKQQRLLPLPKLKRY